MAASASPRVRLAEVVQAAALACPGVAELTPQDRHSTVHGGGRVAGVLVVADGDDGRFSVTVSVHAHLVDDLRALGRELVAAVSAAAADAGLAERLGSVDVVIADLVLGAV